MPYFATAHTEEDPSPRDINYLMNLDTIMFRMNNFRKVLLEKAAEVQDERRRLTMEQRAERERRRTSRRSRGRGGSTHIRSVSAFEGSSESAGGVEVRRGRFS